MPGPDDRIWPWFVLPSWSLSLVLHLGALYGLGLVWQESAPKSATAGDDRVVMIYSQNGHDNPSAKPVGDSSEPSEPATTNAAQPPADPLQDPPTALDDLPVPLELPEAGTRRIGPGPRLPTGLSGVDLTLPDVSRPSVSSSGGPTVPGGGIGGDAVPFFGARAVGKKFAYVLDASGSMVDAIDVAKAELLASLQQLQPPQEFQIVFYTLHPDPIPVPGRGGLLLATEANRAIARQFIRMRQPDSGTEHLAALRLALSWKPDVLFFLTDAEDPRLRQADLDKVRSWNRSQCQIHAIEFGRGADLGGDNFLKKIARQNHGSYSYRDITKFQRRN
jgi:Ca-activated chloride channel family protein